MTASREQAEAFKFEIARLHHPSTQEQETDLVVKVLAKFFVPFSPALDRPLGHFRIFFIRAISCADRFANIRGCGQRMRQRTGIDKNNAVTPPPQFNCGCDAVNACADYDYSRHFK